MAKKTNDATETVKTTTAAEVTEQEARLGTEGQDPDAMGFEGQEGI